ncbi:MAG TPA: DUF748 domain-containing protein [Steroidobacteraceae bacterium]
MDTLRGLLRSRIFWIVTIAAGLVGLYALLGFYVAPRIARSQAIEYVRDTYGRQLAIGEVRIQPFKLQAEIRDLALPDTDGKTMVGFRRLFIDFELSSLWHRAFTFKDLQLDAPVVRAVLHADGSLNLADLVPPGKKEKSPTPAVWVQSFALTDGTLDLLNEMRRNPFLRHLSPVTFTLKNFRTTRGGGGFALAARSPNDEKFQWQGHFALEPVVVSNGTFRVDDLRVPGIAEFVADLLPFRLPRGLVDLEGSYDLKLGETTTLDVDLPKIQVSDVGLRARGVDEDWIDVPSLAITGTRIALPAHAVTVDAITLDGVKAKVWKAPDGTLNTDRLFAAPPSTPQPVAAATPAEPAPATAPAAAEPAAATPPAVAADWTVTVKTVSLQQATLDFEDRTVAPVAKFALAPLTVTLRGASLDLATPLPLEFAATINGVAGLKGSGQVVADPLAVDVDLALSGFAMTDLQPYANGGTALTIRDGTVGAKGHFSMAPPGTGKPELRFTGDVTLAGFKSIDDALDQDFFNFERVEASKLDFALAPDAVKIDRVRVVRPFARVIISPDGIINAAAVFDPEGTAKAAADAKAAQAAREAEAGRKKTRAEVRAAKQAAAEAAKARALAAARPAPALKETGMPVRIREVTITRGTMDFADLSVRPNFAAAVQSLDGSITGLSTDPNSRATVRLAGNVGEFSPVHIDGTLQPFAYDRYTDIGLKFENISLPIFNPYSGKIAGYNIAKGKLTTDLHYTIEARRLKAQHKVRIDQLEWGAATATKGEATLPVKFATSLLKDADGVINLDIPVTGTLDDPSFRIGPIVWQIVKNLITKVVTAPFKALGALFKGAEEAQFVDFAPGSAALDAATIERLVALGKSLAPKEDLRLEVPAGTDPELDGKALAQARYDRELAAALGEVLHGKKKKGAEPPALPAFDTLEPDQKIDVLSVLYRRLSGAPPSLPEPPEPAGDLSRKEAKAQKRQASIDWLEVQCRQMAVADPGEFDRLAQERGEAIQRALLVDTGLAPERVFVTRNGKVTANAPSVRFELSVK